MNSVTLIGRLARDPELSYTPNTQTAVCRFTLAVDRPRRGGEDAGADFIRITVFGKSAENCDRYLSKGRQAAVHGRIQTGSYKNREGVIVYTTDVIADNVEFLGGGNQQQNSVQMQQRADDLQAKAEEALGISRQDPVQMQMTSQMRDLPDTFAAAEDDIPF